MSTHKVCPQWGSAFIVPVGEVSAGSGIDSYMVKFHVGNDPMCTCPAYRYSGHYDAQSCKHIKSIRKYGCFYYEPYKTQLENIQTMGENRLDDVSITLFSSTEKNIIEDKCPGCNQPMIEVHI